MEKYKVVTLCGSVKFKSEFFALQKQLTMSGFIVLMPNFLDDVEYTRELKDMLSNMHKQKIAMSDEIFIVNKNGYIGDSTKSEIEFAKNLNIKVNYLEK